jgi:endonuclease/exonuclease/phosphatase (EEP) superfamily protein YafD
MKITVLLLSSLLLVITLLPFVKKEYWVFRVCDYPRLQKLVLNVVCIVFLAFYVPQKDVTVMLFLGLMLINATYLFYLIIPFTKISNYQVLDIKDEIPENGIKLMMANVLQDNRNYQGCLNEIERVEPNLVLLLETDLVWEQNVKILDKKFPFQVKVPLDNKYGMLLYSEFELTNTSVHYMVEADIPSIHTQVVLPSGQMIQLYAVHPTPPVPNENPSSAERDKELLLIADLAVKSKLPVLVIGDLNDVAWSYTTELFLKMSGLLDPRRGRGFFNSFHAHYPFLRFPLDHAFVSVDWKFKKMIRLRNFDSDHFPIFISLQFEKQAHLEQEGMKPDAADVEEANEKKGTS